MNVKIEGRLTFPGGTHPPQSKDLTRKSRIVVAAAGKQVSVMLSQHIGAACGPVVAKGDVVEAGQKVGDSDAYVCSPVHSPVNGKVKSIELSPHAVMGRSTAVIIETDAENNPVRQPCHERFGADFSAEAYSGEQICDAIRESGLVGMGGAGFPTRVKVEPNAKMPKETMIINGCECEPYITCDYRIMLEWTNQIIAGVKLAKKASGCSQAFIAIEDNKPRAIEIMREALGVRGESEGIRVVVVKTKYPQGGERQLIRSVLETHVPTGGIPPMIGVLVLNVATCAAIAEAVVLGGALTHRVVTVTGEGVGNCGNYYAPIGTAVGDLIELCGGLTSRAAKVILGGPMMGIAIGDLSTPTTKTTGAITVLTKEQIGRAKFAGRQTPCIRCGR